MSVVKSILCNDIFLISFQDDISGGGQWLFRENVDDTPRMFNPLSIIFSHVPPALTAMLVFAGTAYTSSNIWSQLFIH